MRETPLSPRSILPTSNNGDYDPFAFSAAILERFWIKVNRRGPIHPVLQTRCWLWTSNVAGRAKHGQFTLPRTERRQNHIYAHRFSWLIHHGSIPNDLCVLHRCDVARCVNPRHLFLGTQGDNMRDAASKGRLTVPRTRKLTPDERLAIYHSQRTRGSGERLAEQYGVTPAAISLIRSGRFLRAVVERERRVS